MEGVEGGAGRPELQLKSLILGKSTPLSKLSLSFFTCKSAI